MSQETMCEGCHAPTSTIVPAVAAEILRAMMAVDCMSNETSADTDASEEKL